MQILRLGVTDPAVAKWQAVVGVTPTGIFNQATKEATENFQRMHGLDVDGEVGPNTLAVAARLGLITLPSPVASGYYPPRPSFSSPTPAQRDQMFGRFAWKRLNGTDIQITDGWAEQNIIKVHIPQLVGVKGAPADGWVQFHRKGAAQLKAFFAEVEAAGLKHLIISWAGSFYPRFIRGSQSSLSNHSWGTAFDINAPENWLNQQPAAEGKKGSLLRLVPIANKHGFFWGGHYNSRLDGMHFELAKIQVNPFAGLINDSADVPANSLSGDETTSQPTVETPQTGLAIAGVDPPVEQPPINQAEITQSETTNEDGTRQVDTSVKAPANETPGILDHVNSLGDRFQGLQGTLEKFGISNPLASTSAGTWFVTIFKLLFSAIVTACGVLYNNWEFLVIGILVLTLAALIYDRSRNRVAKEKAGVPVELLEKVIDK